MANKQALATLKEKHSHLQEQMQALRKDHQERTAELEGEVATLKTDVGDKEKELSGLLEKVDELSNELEVQAASSSSSVQDLRKSDLSETVVSFTKKVIWRTHKFINDEKPKVLTELTKQVWNYATQKHSDLKAELTEERFLYIYSGLVKESLSQMRNYTMNQIKKVAHGEHAIRLSCLCLGMTIFVLE